MKIRTPNSFKYDESAFDVSGFSYAPETGEIFLNGKEMSRKTCTGYLSVCKNRNRVMAHRLAWRLHFGGWPSGLLDHANGNGCDNRISNLRTASASQNSFNRKSGTNAHTGVVFGRFGRKMEYRYRASVCYGRKRFQQYASSFFSAVIAARMARRVLHGEFSIDNRKVTL